MVELAEYRGWLERARKRWENGPQLATDQGAALRVGEELLALVETTRAELAAGSAVIEAAIKWHDLNYGAIHRDPNTGGTVEVSQVHRAKARLLARIGEYRAARNAPPAEGEQQ